MLASRNTQLFHRPAAQTSSRQRPHRRPQPPAGVEEVLCRAPHPLRHREQFSQRDCHGIFIQEYPVHVYGMRMEPVKDENGQYRVVDSWDQVNYAAGELPFPCWHDGCGKISIYRVLPPDDSMQLPEDIEADAAA